MCSLKSEEVKQLITDLERRASNLKRVRNGFSKIHSEEYRDGVHKQIAILDQVVMRLNWIMRDEGN
ncbi:hypothetical protein ACS47_13380 [Bacillus cereus]|jgi:hypothetical protein|uniref:Uncharacterized protein n=6 Tax=root TaxID=1 RepID=B5LPP4_9CAUD|nr:MULTISPECIES: hypothetical protein [Bacillus]YP_002154358.1 hypothetical protein IEBH_gp33 [Bacillus phage IEBH]YP_009285300.1 hypothetical protein BI093_gp56 [Bacillus phage PfEFR-5]YP_009830784.1 hypothetical protein HWA96_gp55 [Bacillus phage PfEFR-4]ANT40220.1 hypothetical protein [Bacillus phage PfNC7401]ANT40289.1 hypothetical protein [Bacillus phage PfIS075]EJP82527.1 hypothetical protein IAU_05743 [Bacillus cereus IS075]EJR01496.1 hypothetical protein II7_05846 [Bacillus cereus MS